MPPRISCVSSQVLNGFACDFFSTPRAGLDWDLEAAARAAPAVTPAGPTLKIGTAIMEPSGVAGVCDARFVFLAIPAFLGRRLTPAQHQAVKTIAVRD